MKVIKDKDGYVVVLAKGEELTAGLKQFAAEAGVQSAWLSGLGAALSAELGYYDLDSREYHWQTITEPMEVTSISGNIAKKDDEIRLHLHATLAGQDYKAIGGHVNKLITGGTVEIIVQPLSSSLLRARDEQTGLDLLRDS